MNSIDDGEACPSSWSTLFTPTESSIVPVSLLLVTTIFLFHLQLAQKNVYHSMYLVLEFLFTPIPKIYIPLSPSETDDDGIKGPGDCSGNLKDPTKPNKIQCFDPSTLQYLGEVSSMTAVEVNSICNRARKAQVSWSQTSFRQRRRVLRTVQSYIVSHIQEITRVCTRDSGKTPVDALLGEVMTTCEKIRCINANGELWLRPSKRPTGPMMMHKNAYVEYVPFGVLGVIAPWNYPFHNLMNHVISGLFSGNAVVTKVSEHTSWSAEYFSNIVKKALEVHGHDPEVVQIVTGFGEAGEALVKCPQVDKIIFTGSPSVGRKVMAGASASIKPVVLELGGKDPMVFCEDVNLSEVIPWAMRGCFQNCGQNCCGVERLFVYESIHDDFISAATEKVKGMRQGISLECGGSLGDVDCGAMVVSNQIEIVQELIDDAVKKGAKLHCGGKKNPKLSGQFFEPTLISGITSEMRISKEEVFGPIMCVVKVPKDDDDECIILVNDCDFGLGSSVYSGSKKRAENMGRRIRSGMFTSNDFGVNYLIQSLPFGGVKESGFGRFAGPEGLRGCCLERSIVVDRIPGVKTSIPSPIDYPIEKGKGLPFGSSLVQLFYNESLIGKIKGIWGLIKYG